MMLTFPTLDPLLSIGVGVAENPPKKKFEEADQKQNNSLCSLMSTC